MKRLAPQPAERINRRSSLSFTFDGKAMTGLDGDTITSALLASGRTVLSRSFKYHRPRGELCGCGHCSNSLFQIGGSPGVRGCKEPLRANVEVEHQNAWPSLSFDVLRGADKFGGPFMPVGFYYKTFIRPRRLWPLYEKVLRNAAGLGRLPKTQDEREWRTEYRRRHCDVLVIGGGAAGLSAAIHAAEAGADVVLVDDDIEPGGLLLADGHHDLARDLTRQAEAAGVEILRQASALGYFDGLVPVWQGDTLHQVRAQRHIATTGALEQPLVFPDNDLPGIMLSGGVQRLAALYAVGPTQQAVIATTSDRGIAAAATLLAAGVKLAAVADLRADAAQRPDAAALSAAGVPLLAGMTVVRANGGKSLSSVVLARIDKNGIAVKSTAEQVECDVLAVSGGSVPASSLLLQAGAQAIYDAASGRFLPRELPSGVHAAGAVVGYDDALSAEVSGAIAGAEAAIALGFGSSEDQRRLAENREALQSADLVAPIAPAPAYASDGRRGKAFVDLDEDVTVKDIKHAIAEGYDSIELSKRYTTVTMGPSQGRFSQLPAVRVVAAETGRPMNEIGLTTARPPWSTVPMGALAGRPFEVAKRSTIHGRHREAGATVKWAGEWRRAYDYGDPEGEALAVQTKAGLIDVSTLGKLVVRGPDAGEFLDRLYPNAMSNLAPGRIRYGVLCSDSGRITEDGTVCRLDEDAFYVTTTSTGASATEQWFSWWLAAWALDAHVTDVTQGTVAVNLAGPNARQILSRVTDLDCSNEAFKYMDGKRADVAGTPCLLMRIGFVGEVGYEIHCSAAHGQHLWDTLMNAGADLGIRSFGLEPQRILRLQKMHILIGQDTDSESTPYGAAMSWIVKLDKQQDFIGRWALERAQDLPLETALVGFRTKNGHVPTEGSVVVDRGVPAGQVTSARRSPKLNEVIGMAWVPSALARDGAQITISDNKSTFEATVTTQPFYDPEGKVLRS